jgi:hypothetical protein
MDEPDGAVSLWGDKSCGNMNVVAVHQALTGFGTRLGDLFEECKFSMPSLLAGLWIETRLQGLFDGDVMYQVQREYGPDFRSCMEAVCDEFLYAFQHHSTGTLAQPRRRFHSQ